jgi:DNA gyrase/topoisomerase IV subunit A
MAERWRLGFVERSVLETLSDSDALPGRTHRKSANIVERIQSEHGIASRYAYDALCTLAKTWLLHLPLVDIHGNNGSPNGDRPANARYTESRLTRAGAMQLAAERGDGPNVPLVLTNGTLHFDGLAPPYSPQRVVATLMALIDDLALDDAEIVERIGAPASPTGCEMSCDQIALAAGDPSELQQRATITAEPKPDGDLLVLTNLPLGIGPKAIGAALVARVNLGRNRSRLVADSEAFGELGLALRDIQDWSEDSVVCRAFPFADIDELAAQILATWGVTIRVPVQLPAPLPQLVRELVDDDRDAQRNALAQLLEMLEH